jgi:hypothetical protein
MLVFEYARLARPCPQFPRSKTRQFLSIHATPQPARRKATLSGNVANVRSISISCATERTRPSPRKLRRGERLNSKHSRSATAGIQSKQKLRELGEFQEAREQGEITIPYTLERWPTSVKADSDFGNEHTHSKYQTAAKHMVRGLV